MNSAKLDKGKFGYITRYKRKFGTVSLSWLIGILVLYVIGLVIFKTQKNYVTVVAVLAVLPAARVWVGFIMMLPYKAISKEQYDKIHEMLAGKKARVYADHVITKYEGAMHLPLIVNYDDNLFVYAPAQKKPEAQIRMYLNQILKDAGSSSKVQLYSTFERYAEAVERLSAGPDLKGHHTDDIEKQLFIVTL